jgi:hypothetical protein
MGGGPLRNPYGDVAIDVLKGLKRTSFLLRCANTAEGVLDGLIDWQSRGIAKVEHALIDFVEVGKLGRPTMQDDKLCVAL